MSREIVIQLLYGTAILTTIIVAPFVTLHTQLVSRDRQHHLRELCDQVGFRSASFLAVAH